MPLKYYNAYDLCETCTSMILQYGRSASYIDRKLIQDRRQHRISTQSFNFCSTLSLQLFKHSQSVVKRLGSVPEVVDSVVLQGRGFRTLLKDI
jgi:hypothetical protein